MGALVDFARLAAEFVSADFIIVYLEEAHPADGWVYPSVQHHWKQHTTMGERVAAANVLRVELASLCAQDEALAGKIPPHVFVDSMSNMSSLAFGALPERLAILVGSCSLIL